MRINDKEEWIDLAMIVFLFCGGITLLLGGVAILITAINGN